MEVPKEWGTNKIPMHGESLKQMEIFFAAYDTENIHEKTPEQFREDWKKIGATIKVPNFDGNIEEKVIPSKNVKDGIPIRIYKPANLPPVPKILVYFHGGAQMVGDLDIDRAIHRTLAPQCGIIIVDVDYRLCPETKLPGGMDDCVEATKWVLDNKKAVGGSPKSLVGVGGDSAGGQSAIYVCHRVKGVSFQILVYPWADLTYSSPSYAEFEELRGPDDNTEWELSMVLPEGAARDDPRWSAVFHKVGDLVGQPPALVIQAQIDVLRDDGKRYAQMLMDAGVLTTYLEVKGANHGFFSDPGLMPTLCGQAYNQIKAFLSGITS